MIFSKTITLFSTLLLTSAALASDIEVITSDDIAVAGPYVPATVFNGVVYTSGQIALDSSTGKIVGDDVRTQTRQVLKNLSAVLEAAGSSLDQTLKVNVFLQNPADFPAMNEVYTEFFPNHKPSRTTVPGVEWGKGVLVEIDAIAVQSKD